MSGPGRCLPRSFDTRLGIRRYLFQQVAAVNQILKNPPTISKICEKDGIIEAENLTKELVGRENGLLSFFKYISDIMPYKERWTWLDGFLTIRGDEKYLVLLAEKCGFSVHSHQKTS